MDINTCTARQLTGLPGIDATLAESIVRYRKKNRRLKHFDELWRVTGMTRNKFIQLRDHSRVVGERTPPIGTGVPFARVSLTHSTIDCSGRRRRRRGPPSGRGTSPAQLMVTRSVPSAKIKTTASERKTKAKRTRMDVMAYSCNKRALRATTPSSTATRLRRFSDKSATNDSHLSRVTSSHQSPPPECKRQTCPKINHISPPEDIGDVDKHIKASQDETTNIPNAWTPLASKPRTVARPTCSFAKTAAAESQAAASMTKAERQALACSTVATQTSSPTTPQLADKHVHKSPRRSGSWTKPGVPGDIRASVYLQYSNDSVEALRTSSEEAPSSPLSVENVKALERLTSAASDGKWRRKGIEGWVSEVNSSRSFDTATSPTADAHDEDPSTAELSSPMSRLLFRHRLQQNAVRDSQATPLATTGSSGDLLRSRLLDARQRAKLYREQQQCKLHLADVVTDNCIPSNGWRPRHSVEDRRGTADSRASTSCHMNNVSMMPQGKRPPCASSPTNSRHDMAKRPAMLHASELIARLHRERRTPDHLHKPTYKSERTHGTSGDRNGVKPSERHSGDSMANFDDGDKLRSGDRRRKNLTAANKEVLASLLAASSRITEGVDAGQKLPAPTKPHQSAYYKYYQQYHSHHCKDNDSRARARNEACKVM